MRTKPRDEDQPCGGRPGPRGSAWRSLTPQPNSALEDHQPWTWGRGDYTDCAVLLTIVESGKPVRGLAEQSSVS